MSGPIQLNVKDATLRTVQIRNFILLPLFEFSSKVLLISLSLFRIETTKDGFECPTEAIKGVDVNGQTIAHPRFPHPTDCQRFYVCLNGVDARDLGCQAGQVYNDVTQNCDAPENVPGW